MNAFYKRLCLKKGKWKTEKQKIEKKVKFSVIHFPFFRHDLIKQEIETHDYDMNLVRSNFCDYK